jgi:arylsulfatase A-like enzyme
MTQPLNVLFIFSDQHRYQATGYAGDPNVFTPAMNSLAEQGINFYQAVSCAPVCSPYRGSLLTGQYPLTHGVFVNDVSLGNRAVSLAQAYRQAGYDTAYIGKWHLDGHGRSSYIPPERRQGFDTWAVLECTHDYHHSWYYLGDDHQPRLWEGYDALAQTRFAINYLREQPRDRPFLMVISWGPPHNPYETAPRQYQERYDPGKIIFRPNVQLNRGNKPYHSHTLPPGQELAGYYAHISALDDCLGMLMNTLEEQGIAENTLLVYTSDHGDMLWSHGEWRKQWPMDEAIRVPFLLRCPALFGKAGRDDPLLINTPDIMPTLLGLCNLPVPATVEGTNYAPHLFGECDLSPEAALIEVIMPFSEFQAGWGGREYRGVRTGRYTYARDIQGPWLLYDNLQDPYQLNNLCNDPAVSELQTKLDGMLRSILDARQDEFLPGIQYMQRWGYPMDASGAVPFEDILYQKIKNEDENANT